MKTLALILSFLFLVNCYSYKAVSESTAVPESGKTYEITLKNNEKLLVTNLTKDSNEYTYTDKNGKTGMLAGDSVLFLRERKFSYGKTIVLVAGALGIVTVVAVGAAIADLGNNIH